MTCDGRTDEVYINGDRINPISLLYFQDWQRVDNIDIVDDVRSVAIKCSDLGGTAGMLASDDKGLVTGPDGWKCTTHQFTNWYVLLKNKNVFVKLKICLF